MDKRFQKTEGTVILIASIFILFLAVISVTLAIIAAFIFLFGWGLVKILKGK